MLRNVGVIEFGVGFCEHSDYINSHVAHTDDNHLPGASNFGLHFGGRGIRMSAIPIDQISRGDAAGEFFTGHP